MRMLLLLFYLITSFVSFIKSPKANNLWKCLKRFSVVLVFIHHLVFWCVCAGVYMCVCPCVQGHVCGGHRVIVSFFIALLFFGG